MKHPYSLLFLAGALTITACAPIEGTEWNLSSNPDASVDTNACHYNVIKGSPTAWLQTQPEVHFIFWGNWTIAQANVYQTNWSNLLNGGTVLQRLAEYGIQSGSLDSNYYTIIPTNSLLLHPQLAGVDAGTFTLWSDDGVPSELNSEILAGNIPLPNDNTIYMIMLPANTITYDMYHNGWSGYHQWSTYNGQRYTYALIEYRGVHYDQQDEVISHELAEAATDPDITTGWRDYTTSLEIADICVWQTTNVDGLVVQKYFIQNLCVCQ